MKSRAEVDTLKADWMGDQTYDIDNVPGFEEYNDELRQFALRVRAAHVKEWQDRVHATMKNLDCSFKMAEYILRNEMNQRERINSLWEAIQGLSQRIDALSEALRNESRSMYSMIENVEREIEDSR